MIPGSGWVAVYKPGDGEDPFTLPVVYFDDDGAGWVCLNGMFFRGDGFRHFGFAGYKYVGEPLAIPIAVKPGLRVENADGISGTVLAVIIEDKGEGMRADRRVSSVVALVDGLPSVMGSDELRHWRISEATAARRRQPLKRRSGVGDSV